MPNWRLGDATAACNLPKDRAFLIQAVVLCPAGGTGFAIDVLAKMTGVSQVILDRFSEAIIQTGLMSLG
jgi:ethanolamine utilization microcompartment shell protein EutS